MDNGIPWTPCIILSPVELTLSLRFFDSGVAGADLVGVSAVLVGVAAVLVGVDKRGVGVDSGVALTDGVPSLVGVDEREALEELDGVDLNLPGEGLIYGVEGSTLDSDGSISSAAGASVVS